MNIINLLIINSNTHSKILSVLRQPTVLGRRAWITWVIFNSAVGRWPLGGGKQHWHPGLSYIGPGMAEPWTSSLLFVALIIMEFRAYYIHSKSIVVTFKNLNDTLHTQSTNAKHLQCHIMVPPSFNQWDKIGTLQTSFLTNSRMVMLNSSSYSSGTLLWSYHKLQVWLLY